MARRLSVCGLIAVIVVILLSISYSFICENGDEVKWIWELVPPLSLEGDGFVHFCDTVTAFRADAEISADVLTNLVAASDSTDWSARPDMRAFVPLGTERYSDKLTNGTAEVDYTTLISLSKALCDYGSSAASDGNMQEAQDVAVAMLRLGYQIARNKEDIIIATIRINLWKCGTSILHQTKHIDDTKYAEIVTILNADIQSIKKRDFNQLYAL